MTAAITPRFWRFKRWLLLRLLGEYADAAAAQGKSDLESITLDFMDNIVGWCHSSLRLDS